MEKGSYQKHIVMFYDEKPTFKHHISSNVNEFIRAILSFFIYEKVLHKTQNGYKRTKIKNTHKKHLNG